MKFIYATFFVLWFTSCGTNSKYEEKYDNGKLKLTGTIDDNGFRTGMWNQYDIYGNLTKKYYYRQDTVYQQEFYVENTLTSKEEVIGDIKHGITKTYYNSGELKTKTIFFNGKQKGKGINYHRNGSPKIEFSMDGNGNFVGEFKQYYPNGKVNVEAPVNGNSTYSVYDNEGGLQLQIVFEDRIPIDTVFQKEGAIERLTKDMKALNLPE